MILAFTKQTHKELSIQFQKHEVDKRYIAILDGIISEESGEIKLPFRLDPENRPYQIYDPDYGKLGITKWKKIEQNNFKTRIEFTPVTGRSHQLRVHSAYKKGLNCPIVGDRLYGKGKQGDQMLLNANYLSFKHPETQRQMEFRSILPF